jgi:hypothetical protein
MYAGTQSAGDAAKATPALMKQTPLWFQSRSGKKYIRRDFIKITQDHHMVNRELIDPAFIPGIHGLAGSDRPGHLTLGQPGFQPQLPHPGNIWQPNLSGSLLFHLPVLPPLSFAASSATIPAE